MAESEKTPEPENLHGAQGLDQVSPVMDQGTQISPTEIASPGIYPRPLAVMGYSELLATNFTEQCIVSGGILSPGRSLLIIGAPKSGKTLLALNLAVALARGTSWLNFMIPGSQRVLYLSGEGGPNLLQERLRKMIDPSLEIPGSLHFWWLGDERLMLEDPASQNRIAATVSQLRASVVIFDPLIRFHALDENSTTDMARLVAALEGIRKTTNAAMVIVHHSRKAGMRSRRGSVLEARGSSVLHGDIDGSVVLDKRRSSGDFAVNFELRWAPEPEPMRLSLDGERLHFVIEGKLGNTSRKLSDERLLKALREEGECTAAQLAEKTDSTKRTVQRNLIELEKQELVSSRQGPNRTKLWSISEQDVITDDDQ